MKKLQDFGNLEPIGLRARQKLETERLIKQAALSLFRQHGFEATTTKQIADAAGVAQGTVFSVAPTKEALFVAIFEDEIRARAKERIASLPSKDVKAQLLHLFGGLFDFYEHEPALSRTLVKGLMFAHDPGAKAHHTAHMADFVRLVEGLLEAAKARGEIAKSADVSATTTTVLAIYVYLLIAFLGDDAKGRAALDAKLGACLDVVLR